MTDRQIRWMRKISQTRARATQDEAGRSFAQLRKYLETALDSGELQLLWAVRAETIIIRDPETFQEVGIRDSLEWMAIAVDVPSHLVQRLRSDRMMGVESLSTIVWDEDLPHLEMRERWRREARDHRALTGHSTDEQYTHWWCRECGERGDA